MRPSSYEGQILQGQILAAELRHTGYTYRNDVRQQEYYIGSNDRLMRADRATGLYYESNPQGTDFFISRNVPVSRARYILYTDLVRENTIAENIAELAETGITWALVAAAVGIAVDNRERIKQGFEIATGVYTSLIPWLTAIPLSAVFLSVAAAVALCVFVYLNYDQIKKHFRPEIEPHAATLRLPLMARPGANEGSGAERTSLIRRASATW